MVQKTTIEEDIGVISIGKRDAVEYAANLETVRINRWRFYEDSTKKIGSLDTTAQDLELEQLQPGWIYAINNICAYETPTATPQIKIGFVRGHQFHRLTSQTVAAAENSVDYVGQVLLMEGDKIRARFEGATEGDTIYIFATGYKIRR